MTDAQIERVLAQGKSIAAVLLARGGWLRSPSIHVRVAFAADATSPAVWAVELMTDDTPWHSVYLEAETIVGISVVSYDPSNAPSEIGIADQ